MLFAICLLDPAEHVTDDRNHESNNRIISYRSYQPTVESLYCELWRELNRFDLSRLVFISIIKFIINYSIVQK